MLLYPGKYSLDQVFSVVGTPKRAQVAHATNILSATITSSFGKKKRLITGFAISLGKRLQSVGLGSFAARHERIPNAFPARQVTPRFRTSLLHQRDRQVRARRRHDVWVDAS